MSKFNTISFAKSYLTIEEAMEYISKEKITINNYGKENRSGFKFKSEYDKRIMAKHIVNIGIDNFEKELNKMLAVNALNDISKTDPIITLFTTSPNNVSKYVYGDGIHHITGQSYGVTSFEKNPNEEYLVKLSYNVTIRNRVITSISNIELSFPSTGQTLEMNNFNFTPYYAGNYASVSASYVVSKTVAGNIFNIDLLWFTEEDVETFSVKTFAE